MYTHIVIDSPPILSVTDGSHPRPVRRCGRPGDPARQVQQARHPARARSAGPLRRSMAGIVLNAVDLNSPEYYGYYGYSGYSYGSMDADSWETQAAASPGREEGPPMSLATHLAHQLQSACRTIVCCSHAALRESRSVGPVQAHGTRHGRHLAVRLARHQLRLQPVRQLVHALAEQVHALPRRRLPARPGDLISSALRLQPDYIATVRVGTGRKRRAAVHRQRHPAGPDRREPHRPDRGPPARRAVLPGSRGHHPGARDRQRLGHDHGRDACHRPGRHAAQPDGCPADRRWSAANASHTVKIVRRGKPEPIVVDLGTDLATSEAANMLVYPARHHPDHPRQRRLCARCLRAPGFVPLDQASPLTLMQLAALSGGIGFEGRYRRSSPHPHRRRPNARWSTSTSRKSARAKRRSDPPGQRHRLPAHQPHEGRAQEHWASAASSALVSLLIACARVLALPRSSRHTRTSA